MWFVRNLSKLNRNLRRFHSQKQLQDVPVDKIRNLGILAHIDAGKTTTTERMLYYSGLIRQMGEVHHGNTVTDYMDQERERGITITSAAVTFYWKKNQFNLIDTPGHIDFTMEVERTLQVLDGAVVILDGSAGVEPQTLTVWRQADKYNVPRIVYVNKMDKRGASLEESCVSIERKLEIPCLNLQLPVFKNDKLVGIIDVLTLELLDYSSSKIERIPLNECDHGDYWERARSARNDVINKSSDFDDELANIVIACESLDDVRTIDVVKALRKITNKQLAVPVLLGSSYKNVGVQPLMDAVILYLPSPNERNNIFYNFKEHLCARAFKVIHDNQKGPLVFLRIYNGSLKKGQRVYSIKQDFSEQVKQLYIAYADDFKEVQVVGEGNIAVVAGLKKINSGDLVTNSNSSSQAAKKSIMKQHKGVMDEAEVEKTLGIGVSIPEPVFFCSIEPPSLKALPQLEYALTQLQREDPSLRVSFNAESGQTILAGMGELHIEIIRDRILKEYKIDVDLGPLQIAYRESPLISITDSISVDTKIGNSRQSITAKMSLLPVAGTPKELLRLDKSPEYAGNIAAIFPKHLVAVRQGVEVGLAQGPKISCQVINTQVMLHYLEVGRGTSDTMIASTITQLVQKLLKKSGTDILEPVMYLEIVTPEDHLTTILADLSKRRSNIDMIGVRGNSKVISVKVPLSELMGYSTILRTLSSGTATYAMEFDEYKKMTADNEIRAIRAVRGF